LRTGRALQHLGNLGPVGFQTALVYGKLVRSAFDLHRFALYERVHWSLPKWTNDETALVNV
jgi:hypothetical protein